MGHRCHLSNAFQLARLPLPSSHPATLFLLCEDGFWSLPGQSCLPLKSAVRFSGSKGAKVEENAPAASSPGLMATERRWAYHVRRGGDKRPTKMETSTTPSAETGKALSPVTIVHAAQVSGGLG